MTAAPRPSRSPPRVPARYAGAATCGSSRDGADRERRHGDHHDEAFSIGACSRWFPRHRCQRRRSAMLHPLSPVARPQRPARRGCAANLRAHRTLPAAIQADALSRAPLDCVIPPVEIRCARLKVQEVISAPPRTGGLRSTPDCAAAARGTNLYFVMPRMGCPFHRALDSCHHNAESMNHLGSFKALRAGCCRRNQVHDPAGTKSGDVASGR